MSQDSEKVRRVRMEGTTLRLWDLRIASFDIAALSSHRAQTAHAIGIQSQRHAKAIAFGCSEEGHANKSACVAARLGFENDSCGVRTHALSDWRLEPAP